jgi:anaerobic selenocysteine-containing dehydrogenase
VRALIVSGGNPAVALPDPIRSVEAFRALDLLVTIDPFPSETARLAHYVIAPVLALERADHTRPYERGYSQAFAQWTPAVLPRPSGVIEDWEFFTRLAQAMELPLAIGSHVIAPDDPLPSNDQALAWLGSRGRAPLEGVQAHPHGVIFDDLEPLRVAPRTEDGGRFRLLPDDVRDELEAAVASAEDAAKRGQSPDRFLLVVRRSKTAMNTLGRRTKGLAKTRWNPCGIHPADGARLGISDGAIVRIISDHGSVLAVAALDATLRPGCASLTHCYGDLPGEDGDPRRFGTNPNRLVSGRDERQAINAMPRFTAIPVTIVPAEAPDSLDTGARA